MAINQKSLRFSSKAFKSYPVPESNRHGFPQVFETSASTNSANWALLIKRDANL
jgi:hypothetical protein